MSPARGGTRLRPTSSRLTACTPLLAPCACARAGRRLSRVRGGCIACAVRSQRRARARTAHPCAAPLPPARAMAAPRGAPARRAAPPRAPPAAALLLAALLGAARPVTAKKTTAAYGTPPNRPGKDVFATAANLTKVMLDDPLALCNDNSQGVSRAVPLGPTACAAWCKQPGGARPICAHAARGRGCGRCGAARMGAGSRLRAAGCGPGRALAWPDVYRALALRCRWLLLCPCVGPALPEQLAGVFGGGAVVRGARRTPSSRHCTPPLGASHACTARGLTPPRARRCYDKASCDARVAAAPGSVSSNGCAPPARQRAKPRSANPVCCAVPAPPARHR